MMMMTRPLFCSYSFASLPPLLSAAVSCCASRIQKRAQREPPAPAPAMVLVQIQVTVPANGRPGTVLQVAAPGGAVIQATVPAGAAPGSSFVVQADVPGSPLNGNSNSNSNSNTPSPALPKPTPADAAAAAPKPETQPQPQQQRAPASTATPNPSTGCCLSRADCRRAARLKLDEAPGKVSRCLVYNELVSTVLAVAGMLFATVVLTWQFWILQRLHITPAYPIPMFIEGTCMCNGTLCPNVAFTMNLTSPDFCAGAGGLGGPDNASVGSDIRDGRPFCGSLYRDDLLPEGVVEASLAEPEADETSSGCVGAGGSPCKSFRWSWEQTRRVQTSRAAARAADPRYRRCFSAVKWTDHMERELRFHGSPCHEGAWGGDGGDCCAAAGDGSCGPEGTGRIARGIVYDERRRGRRDRFTDVKDVGTFQYLPATFLDDKCDLATGVTTCCAANTSSVAFTKDYLEILVRKSLCNYSLDDQDKPPIEFFHDDPDESKALRAGQGLYLDGHGANTTVSVAQLIAWSGVDMAALRQNYTKDPDCGNIDADGDDVARPDSSTTSSTSSHSSSSSSSSSSNSSNSSGSGSGGTNSTISSNNGNSSGGQRRRELLDSNEAKEERVQRYQYSRPLDSRGDRQEEVCAIDPEDSNLGAVSGWNCQGGRRFKMVLLPADQERARRSVYDDACWTSGEHNIHPNDERVEPKKPASPRKGQRYWSFLTHQHLYAALAVGGSVFFVQMMTGIIAWQTVISEFAPPGHVQAGMSLRPMVCEPPCLKRCPGTRLAHLGVEVAHYLLVDLPFNTFLSVFTQSGRPMGTFFGREEVCTRDQFDAGEVDDCVWEDQALTDIDYGGGAMWYPTIEGMGTIFMILFGVGVIWPCWVPTLCYTCAMRKRVPKDDRERRVKMFCMGFFPFIYGVCVCILFGFVINSFVQQMSGLTFGTVSLPQMVLTVDWPIRVPAGNFVAAVSALLLGLSRLSVLFSKLSLGMVKCLNVGKLAGKAGQAAASAAKNATKVTPQSTAAASNAKQTQLSKAQGAVEEALTAKATEVAQEKAIEQADRALSEAERESVTNWTVPDSGGGGEGKESGEHQ